MEFLPKAFEALAQYNQFILYMVVPSRRSGKMDKMPVNWRTGKVANAHDPKIWLSAADAIVKAKELKAGVGFVFTENDPFFFLDVDDCATELQWSKFAVSLLNAFAGAAYEVSSSGRGLHVIGTGTVPPHGCRNAAHKLELYTSGRFVALTGTGAGGDSGFDCSAVLPWLVQSYFAASAPPVPSGDTEEWTNTPVPEWHGNVDDTELLARMLKSKPAGAIFGDGVAFVDLWEANEAVLAKAYPPNDTDTYNRSSADAALAQRLAFWTGKDCERILRFMEGSALKREKWDRVKYLRDTILAVCRRQKEVLCDKQPEYIAAPPPLQEDETPRPQLVSGSTFLTIDQQIDYFTGFVYISDEHKVMNPKGELFTPERFKSYYGGYQMILDPANAKVTRNAFEAFTESQGFRAPRAESSCFLPKRTPGSIIIQDGRRLVNVYYPAIIRRVQGDITPFLTHINKLFVTEQDRTLILSYIAALVQHLGTKFQWAPLIQGVQGNGKTLITRIVAYCIGQQYCHFPRAEDIDNNFNSWLYRRLFIGMEDVYLRDAKTHVVEILKPMITNDRQEVEHKGRDKTTVDICANFILNTNHKDGLRKTRDDRRFAPFYTAQQTVEDLKRDGMTGDYFPKFRQWLERDGFAIIAHYLLTYPILDEFNPATLCIRAPETSSTEAAINHGVGRIEQEIIEAIAQGLAGFRNGWVSSIFLDRLLISVKADKSVPRNKRRDMMRSLGYDWHPALVEGRVTRVIQPDGGKPTLYIKTDHASLSLMTAEEVAKAYTESQS